MEAPTHLSERSRELWHQLTTDSRWRPPRSKWSGLALEALDRCEEARSILARDGLTSRGRYGQVLAHPAVAIERDSRLAAARLFKQLALPDARGESVSPLALPPRRRAS